MITVEEHSSKASEKICILNNTNNAANIEIENNKYDEIVCVYIRTNKVIISFRSVNVAPHCNVLDVVNDLTLFAL